MDVFGLDIGGSGIKGAPVNAETGDLLGERIRVPTPEAAMHDSGSPDSARMPMMP